MRCDICEELMSEDETGAFNFTEGKGGHTACIMEPVQEEELNDYDWDSTCPLHEECEG